MKTNRPHTHITRRTALRTLGLAGLGSLTAAARISPPPIPEPAPTYQRWNGQPLARIAQEYQEVRAQPTRDSDLSGVLYFDDVIRVRRVVSGEAIYPNNDLWLETHLGYLYASFVQPVDYHLPTIPQKVSKKDCWAELIVPYSDTLWRPDPQDRSATAGRVYYRSIHHVAGLETDPEGGSWYRVDELYQTIYIRATHLRIIPDHDLKPLSPGVPASEKRLEVNIEAQTLTAFEYDIPVWSQLISSGILTPNYETPKGEFFIYEKRVSSRLLDLTEEDDPDMYNLPGVPFVCYFGPNRVATHGVYWHNDFGRAVSHGCINLPPDSARWLWRWATPRGSLTELYTMSSESDAGTRIDVF